MRLIPIPIVAERLSVSESTVRRLLASRELPAVRVGERRVLVAEGDLEAYVAANKMAETTAG